MKYPCMTELLYLIDVKGKTITADVMHCQKKTAAKIIKKKCNYVFQVKNNQDKLYEDIDLMFTDLLGSEYKKDKEKFEKYETLEKGHGRTEKRECYVLTETDWTNLRKVFAVKRTTTINEKITSEISCYITSLDSDSKSLLRISREYWKIESMHWVLDVVMSEDECRLVSKNGQCNMNVLKKLAIVIHKNYTLVFQKNKYETKYA